jgi:hypothetical protein
MLRVENLGLYRISGMPAAMLLPSFGILKNKIVKRCISKILPTLYGWETWFLASEKYMPKEFKNRMRS